MDLNLQGCDKCKNVDHWLLAPHHTSWPSKAPTHKFVQFSCLGDIKMVTLNLLLAKALFHLGTKIRHFLRYQIWVINKSSSKHVQSFTSSKKQESTVYQSIVSLTLQEIFWSPKFRSSEGSSSALAAVADAPGVETWSRAGLNSAACNVLSARLANGERSLESSFFIQNSSCQHIHDHTALEISLSSQKSLQKCLPNLWRCENSSAETSPKHIPTLEPVPPPKSPISARQLSLAPAGQLTINLSDLSI